MEIKLSGVTVFLPSRSKPLFRIADLSFPKGSRVLIHGPSGQGKTTLLHLIAGLLSPSEGNVYIDGKNLKHLSDEERARLRRDRFGIVFQRLNLIDHLTGLENVLLGSRPGPEAAKRAREAMEGLGIARLAESRTANLSLGEQQRCAVARVVALQPRIVLADEPTSSLDEKNAQAVCEALVRLPGDPTVVVVSHDERIRPHFGTVLQFDSLGGAAA